VGYVLIVDVDVMMPGVDGFQACRAIKQDPSTWLIPVVLVSALLSTTNRLRGIGLELRARVRSLLRIKRHTDDRYLEAPVATSHLLSVYPMTTNEYEHNDVHMKRVPTDVNCQPSPSAER
jgi:CheY-like chemotaxis protein